MTGIREAEHAAEVLAAEIGTVQHELARVDGKAATLAAIAGAGLAFLVTQLNGSGPVAPRVLLGLAVLGFAAAVVLLLALLRPRLGNGGFNAHARASGVPEIRAWAELADRATVLAEELLTLSRITVARQRRLRRAIDTLGVAILATVAAGAAQLIL